MAELLGVAKVYNTNFDSLDLLQRFVYMNFIFLSKLKECYDKMSFYIYVMT